jgi:hypothetical protein
MAYRARTLSGSVGIFAQSLAMIFGLGGDIATNFAREDSTVWRFKKLETNFIVPNQKYIEESMAVEEVKKYFEAKENKNKSAFMITGVKIARGAEAGYFRAREIGGDGSAGFDGTGAGVPVSAGPTMSLTRRTVDNESFSGSSDFVFAYRLIKIYRNRKTGTVSGKDHVKGALYEHGAQKWKEEKTEGGVTEKGAECQEFEVSGFDKIDFGITNTPPGFEAAAAVEDDEEECTVLLPKY